MHVAHHTDDLLVVEHQPWTLAWLLTAAAIAGPWALFQALGVTGIGPTLLAVFTVDFPLFVLFTVYVRRLQVTLDRTRDDLHLHERSLLRDRDLHLPLSALVRAERETNWKRLPWLPKHGQTHRAVLIVARDRHLTRCPVSSVYLVGPSARRAARAINAWLGRPLDSRAPAA